MAERFKVLHGQQWGEKLGELLQQPPADIVVWMQQHTRVIKNDRYSVSGLLRLADRDCFLKCYRYKSPLRKIFPVLGDRRAVHSFCVAQALASSTVPVPAALTAYGLQRARCC